MAEDVSTKFVESYYLTDPYITIYYGSVRIREEEEDGSVKGQGHKVKKVGIDKHLYRLPSSRVIQKVAP